MKASKIRAVDFIDDLASPYARRRFLWSFVTILVVSTIGFALASKLPQAWPKELLQSFFGEAAAGSAIILTFYCVYLYFIGPHTPATEVTVVRPQDIGDLLQQFVNETRHYEFWGRTGAFFRSKSLTDLSQQATGNRRQISVVVLLPDPNDTTLTTGYGRILNALGEEGSSRTLVAQVLATCFACAVEDANNMHLDVSVYLSKHLPTYRLDLSDRGVLLTHDDKKRAALHFKKDGELYDLWRSAIASESDRSVRVTWDRDRFRDVPLTREGCTPNMLASLNVNIPDHDGLEDEVAELVGNPRHRYG